MTKPCGNCFVCKRCKQLKTPKSDCTTCRQCPDCWDTRVRCWRAVSEPFVVPKGLVGHRCRWQCIDFDLAGCTECGAIHRCDAATCPVFEEEDSHVCTITGNCVRLKRFTHDEFMDNVVISDLPGPVEREVQLLTDEREVRESVEWLLSSRTAQHSFEQERGRMEQKHRHLLWKLLRETKLRGGVPNLCQVMTQILHATNKIRVCNTSFQPELRQQVVGRCVYSIVRFLNLMGQRFRSALGALKTSTLVVGTLYLMRMGISMHNITLLPRMPQLQLILPMETHLKTFFQIKCKSITEVENLIKMCLRGLSPAELEKMGFTMAEEILGI
jgi:hypothetical protein